MQTQILLFRANIFGNDPPIRGVISEDTTGCVLTLDPPNTKKYKKTQDEGLLFLVYLFCAWGVISEDETGCVVGNAPTQLGGHFRGFLANKNRFCLSTIFAISRPN